MRQAQNDESRIAKCASWHSSKGTAHDSTCNMSASVAFVAHATEMPDGSPDGDGAFDARDALLNDDAVLVGEALDDVTGAATGCCALAIAINTITVNNDNIADTKSLCCVMILLCFFFLLCVVGVCVSIQKNLIDNYNSNSIAS